MATHSRATGTVKIVDGAFDPWRALVAHQDDHLTNGQYGATATFVGTMRDFNDGDEVTGMTLEHYPGMTEAELQRIIDEAQARWSLNDVLIVHRVGCWWHAGQHIAPQRLMPADT